MASTRPKPKTTTNRKALAAIQEAIASRNNVTQKSNADFIELAELYNQAGALCYQSHQLLEAIHFFEMAISSGENTDATEEVKCRNFSVIYDNIAIVKMQQNDLIGALNSYKIATALRDSTVTKDDTDYAFLLACADKVCEIYFQQDKLDEAKIELQKAIAHAKNLSANNKNKILALAKCTNSLEMLKLAEEAKSWGFECIDVPHDGDCFFHAIQSQLALQNIDLMRGLSAIKLRAKAVNHISRHFEQYQDAIPENERNNFIAINAKSGEWVGDELKAALSRELKLTIVIIQNDGAKPFIQKCPDAVATVYLGYEKNRHYLSLKPRPDWIPTKDIQQLIDNTEAYHFTPSTASSSSQPTNTHSSFSAMISTVGSPIFTVPTLSKAEVTEEQKQDFALTPTNS